MDNPAFFKDRFLEIMGCPYDVNLPRGTRLHYILFPQVLRIPAKKSTSSELGDLLAENNPGLPAVSVHCLFVGTN